MRSMIRSLLLVTALFCLATQTTSAQQSPVRQKSDPPLPTVVVVPPDELSRTPSLSPSTKRPDVPASNQPVMAKPVKVMAKATPVAPRVFPSRHSYNKCEVSGPYVAMTFDDGPHPKLTPQLLDILKERGIKATFFVVGKNVAAYPEIVRRMVEEGHEVANHTWSHPRLTRLSTKGLKTEMDDTTRVIEEAGGVRPITMRPPYGATSKNLDKTMDEEFGMKVIMWSVDPQDWRYRNAKRVASHIVENTKAGDIILAHDIHATTVAAMPEALDALRASGLEFVTVSELLAMEGAVELASREEAAEAPEAPAYTDTPQIP